MNTIYIKAGIICLFMLHLHALAANNLSEWETPSTVVTMEDYGESNPSKTTLNLPLLRVGIGDPNDPNNGDEPELGLEATPIGEVPVIIIAALALLYGGYMRVRIKKKKYTA